VRDLDHRLYIYVIYDIRNGHLPAGPGPSVSLFVLDVDLLAGGAGKKRMGTIDACSLSTGYSRPAYRYIDI
jgi:hypothetical protein